MSMELILKSAEVSIPQAIENIEQLKEELAPKLKYYSSLVVTEDSIKNAKSDKANLNKLKKAIDEQRKDVKKKCLALYEPLEQQCKELIGMIDAPITIIDKQIKNFDDIKKQEKHQALQKHFDEVNTLEFVTLEDVINPKWSNATMKLETLKDEISQSVDKITSDYKEIKELYNDSPLLTAILDRFIETKDKASALSYAAVIEKREQQRKEAEEHKSDVVQKSAGIPSDVKVTQPVANEVVEQQITGTFKVTCTRSQLISLREFMKNNNIKFEVI